jgi:hypothetical protein
MNDRTPWICPRCGCMNAPHVDHCDCAGDSTASQPIWVVPPQPTIPSPTLTWWDQFPIRITSSGTTINSEYAGAVSTLTLHATNEGDALFSLGGNTTTGVQ